MNDRRILIEIEEHSYDIFVGEEEVVEQKTVEDCKLNCRFCKNIGVCDYGVHSNSL